MAQQKKDLSQQLAKPLTNENSLSKSEQSQTQKPPINILKVGSQTANSSNTQATQSLQKQMGKPSQRAKIVPPQMYKIPFKE